MKHQIILGDVLDGLKTLPDTSVHCVVTSPPYFGLRDYNTATWDGGDPECDHKKTSQGKPTWGEGSTGSSTLKGKPTNDNHVQQAHYKDICGKCGAVRVDKQIGLEETPEAYVAKLVEVFREVRRVLRDDGTVFLNLGDSYAGSGGSSGHTENTTNCGRKTSIYGAIATGGKTYGLKPKDLIGIPWRVAFALQADGWFLRQDIIWSKNSCMPESVTDRCTKSHEYLFLLTKKSKYFFDHIAIQEPAAYDGRKDEIFKGAIKSYDGVMPNGQPQSFAQSGHERWRKDENGLRVRNKRSVWTINPQPYPDSHFAVFPTALIEPCVKAGTSEYGCCSVCGAPYIREIEEYHMGDGNPNPYEERKIKGNQLCNDRKGKKYYENAFYPKTLSWQPSCECKGNVIPCTVLDIFGGSGTTMIVSRDLNRSSICIELNPDYVKLIRKRLKIDQQLDTGVYRYEIKSV